MDLCEKKPLRRIAIVPIHNSKGKKDVTGAFKPEAIRWAKIHGDSKIIGFDNRMSKRARRNSIAEKLSRYKGCKLDQVAIFCHGWKRGIQTGHTTANVDHLARLLHECMAKDGVVSLYCCDTARDLDKNNKDDLTPGIGGDGGFADQLRDALVFYGMEGGWVDGHTVTAHTTKTPFVRRFLNTQAAKGVGGGGWIVVPRTDLWNDWKQTLRHSALFRLSYSRFSAARVRRYLQKANNPMGSGNVFFDMTAQASQKDINEK